MPRELLRFVLTTADQLRADPGSVTSVDDPADPALLRIAFSLADPVGAAPAVVPPFAGSVHFVADEAAPGAVPTVDAAGTLTPAGRAAWTRRGMLLVSASASTAQGFATHATDIAIAPDLAWVGPVELPETFFDAIADDTVIARSTIVSGDRTVRPTDPTWAAHATAGFLGGRLGLPFIHDAADPTRDTIALLIAAGRAPAAIDDGSRRFTVDVRMAVHAGPLDPTASADPPPLVADDGVDAGLAGPGPPITQASPAHPSNGAVPARYVLQWLRADLLDGSAASPVADAVIDDQTMWLPVRVSMYSHEMPEMAFGRLPAILHEVERPAAPTETAPVFDVARAPLPHHGVLVLHNAQLTGVPATRTLRLIGDIGDAITVIGCTRGPGQPPNFEVVVFDLPPDTIAPRIALLPPSGTLEELAAVASHEVDALMSSPRITAGVTERYARVEAAIGRSPYPTSWDPNESPTTFHGARSPWSGITAGFVEGLLLGVGQVEITGSHPPIRPADVFVTWLLEGLFPMIETGNFRPDFLPSVPGFFRMMMGGWSDTEAEAVKTTIRVGHMFNHCGLDSFNAHSGAASDNTPILDPDPTAMKNVHNAAFDAYRGGIVGRGVSCPTRQQLHATFSVAKVGSVWKGTPGAGYTSVLAQLVAAGLYDHQLRFIDNLISYGIDIDRGSDLPAAFRYMCYNAGPGVAAAGGETWETVDTGTIATSLRHYINGLRDMTDQPGVWPTLNDWLAKDRIGLNEESRTSGGTRTNAIHFWILNEEFGITMPPAIPTF